MTMINFYSESVSKGWINLSAGTLIATDVSNEDAGLSF